MKKYPIGIQDFEVLRKNNYLYIDKTMYLEKLFNISKYYFLSRPRRFGKSLFINTLEALIEGKKELFEGLYIANKWDWSKSNPVIKIGFNGISHKEKGLYNAINDRLDEIAVAYKVEIDEKSISAKFQKLIIQLYEKYGPVAILIDEYDKPIIDYLGTDTAKAIENRDIMKSFYSILKDADPYLKIVLLTGISKFARVSIFSDLNNLYDLSIDDSFAGVCGITQEELEQNFVEELQKYDKQAIKEWYNGYTWDMKTSVYNPYSLLTFFENGRFGNYWFSSGTPTFLINLTKNRQLYNFENIKISAVQIESYDIEKLQIIPLMYQTGYLTFKNRDDESGVYTLGYPNKEVKRSYLDMLATAYIDNDMIGGTVVSVEIRDVLKNKELEKLQDLVNSLFASIPYDLWKNQSESFYHAILHIIFSLVGVYVQSEVHTSAGRIDCLVQTERYVYCFEFKLDFSALEALQQIKDKGYLKPYLQQGKECIAIGVNFSKEQKQVAEILWESVG